MLRNSSKVKESNVMEGKAMHKDDLYCGYCGGQDFIEVKNTRHPEDSRYSSWECNHCHAGFEDNPGYGWFTSWPPDEEHGAYAAIEKYSLATGELLDDTRLPRTPEGIVRHSGSKEELEAYLVRTQVK